MRYSDSISKKHPRKRTAKAPKPKLTVAEIREKIGDEQKEILHSIDGRVGSIFEGTPTEIVEKLKAAASEYGVEKNFIVAKRGIMEPTYPGSYRKASRQRLCIIGRRPYTDAELEKEGEKIVREVERRRAAAEKKRRREIAKFNELAVSLGQKPLPVE